MQWLFWEKTGSFCKPKPHNLYEKRVGGIWMQKKFSFEIEKRLSRFRGWVLLLLLITAGGLIFAPPPKVSPADAEKPPLPLAGFTVALDPGHGGYDGGARAQDSGLWEKELTLQIALKTEEALLEKGATVILTRRSDICLAPGNSATKARKRQDLQKRMDLAVEGGADVLISIHMNEYRNRSESGPQVFYQKGGQAGQLLAQTLQQSMIAVLHPKKQRSAMSGDYYVLRSKLPSALVECGFISNSAEEKLLLTPDYQLLVARSIAEGLVEYRHIIESDTGDVEETKETHSLP